VEEANDMIEKSVVEEILARASIEDVISPYVSLKRAGSLLKGLCPFHGEKTASFCAYPKDNSFYCFGCGAGGDAITFVRRIENVEFEDAVEILAKRVGITVLRTERDGKVVSEAPVRVIEEQICSQRTLDTLRSFMEEVSLTGTAAEYFGEKKCSFRTGSKTGTAQVDTEINGVRYKRGDGYYYGSMVTYLPADNPRYIIMTAIFTKRQTGKFYYGASLAGPVQKKVATFLHNRDRQYAEEVAEGKYRASKIKGGNIDKMRKVAGEYGEKFSTESRHGWGRCEMQQEGFAISLVEVEEGCVPNVVGMGLDDALFLLEKCGLAVDIVGCGKVAKQSIAPKTKVAKTGKRITITLK
jgi:hypothetical protein